MKNKLKIIWNNLIEGGKEKLIWRVVIIILTMVVIFSGVMSIKSQINKKQSTEKYDALQELAKVEDVNEALEIDEEEVAEFNEIIETENLYELVSDYPKLDLDYLAIEDMNSDLVGWIYIPALELSYPVVLYEDNAYYLEYSFEKRPSILGCIFIDYESPSDWTGLNTLMFGHNMKDKSMFGSLKRFIREDGLLESNPYIYIYTEEEVLIYRIFSLYITEDGSQRYRIVQDANDLAWYAQEAKDLSTYNPGVEFEQMDHLLSLSTCYGIPGTSNRLLLHGVLLERGVREEFQIAE